MARVVRGPERERRHRRWPLYLVTAVAALVVFVPLAAAQTFTDVPTTHPFYNQIERAYAAGMIGACIGSPPPPNQTFCPGNFITKGTASNQYDKMFGLDGSPRPFTPTWRNINIITGGSIAPFTVDSQVKVGNLNADLLDGMNAADFALAGHNHDDRYYTKSELSAPGTINAAANPVDWSNLKNVPAGFADGSDDGGSATYNAGDGLSLTGNTFSADFGPGPNQVARGSHDHYGSSWSGSAFRGFSVSTSSADRNAAAVFGEEGAGSNAGPYNFAAGVRGDSDSAATTGVLGTSDAGTGVYGLSNTGTAVWGESAAGDGASFQGLGTGVTGFDTSQTPSGNHPGVKGISGPNDGTQGFSHSGNGVYGNSDVSNGVSGFSGTGNGVYGTSTSGKAGWFDGDVKITGSIDLVGGGLWKEGGNAGTNPATSFLGTADNKPLNLRVNNERVLHIESGGNGILFPNAPNLVGGSLANSVAAGISGATIAGGGRSDAPWSNAVSASFGTVSGGQGNTASGFGGSVGGGIGNTASGQNAIVSGGRGNSASGFAASVAGWFNTASGDYSFAGAGSANAAKGSSSTVAGGDTNEASGVSSGIGGGTTNIASDDYSFVGGGRNNKAGDNAGTTADRAQATVAGGWSNTASGLSSTIGGGFGNTSSGGDSVIAGGSSNIASGSSYSAVAGGNSNTASGFASFVAGGRNNVASASDTFAAGRRANATNNGSLVWGDSTDADVGSVADNSVTMRASGGYRLFSNSGLTSGVQVAAGSGSWSSLSDRNAKERFRAVDGGTILRALAGIPMLTWNYKAQKPSIRHIGPMAQDFAKAFHVGEDAKHISTVDAEGVNMAATQALYKLVQKQQRQIDLLQKQVRTLQKH